MSSRRLLWRVLLLALAGITVGLSLFQWNAETLTGNRMPMPLGFGVSVVLTGSMEPTLHAGDLAVIRKTDQIRPGDIVVYQDARDLVIHRVISIDGDTLITQGDANNTADDPIRLQAVKGVLAFHVPYLGRAVTFLKQPWAVGGILLLAFGLTECSYRREKRRAQAELEDIQAQIRSLADELRRQDEK